jgi:hypothetical protein
MSNLVTVEKDGKQLRIHVDALAQHQKLGWAHVEDAQEEAEEATSRRGRKPKAQEEAE